MTWEQRRQEQLFAEKFDKWCLICENFLVSGLHCMTLKTSASYFSFSKTLQQETIDMLKTNQNFLSSIVNSCKNIYKFRRKTIYINVGHWILTFIHNLPTSCANF
jgi:hypothetical protein